MGSSGGVSWHPLWCSLACEVDVAMQVHAGRGASLTEDFHEKSRRRPSNRTT